ncbi:hypothetical protein [Moorena sp. SIO4G3]|uniref:hypothetical protein n=1 Tax=Moorena sp. SIO4G3 TaxID=2607821 RepID=UPI00142923DD|nr:hypothetical protein [Moorena sp. SIO4G3]NEO82108.1 hypothetical protein [Moorena sp. SIO4G3]
MSVKQPCEWAHLSHLTTCLWMVSALIEIGQVKQDPLDSRSSHGSANMPKANSVGCSLGCHFARINIHGLLATLREDCINR